MRRPKAGEPYTFKCPDGVLYWHPPARRGAGGGEGPSFTMEPCLDGAGGVYLGTGSHRFWAPDEFLRAVVADRGADAIATLTRERDEARAALALAHTRALQAAADVVREHGAALPCSIWEPSIEDRILDLTTDDIHRIAEEHDHD